MSIWFTADLHLWHTNVIKYCNRPFKTVEEMNEKLVANWNSVVKPEDAVYVLGDFSMAFRPVETFTPRLMGTKHLIAGNHDFCHPAHKKSRNPEKRAEWEDKYIRAGFASVKLHEMLLTTAGVLHLSHMPYAGDHGGQDRFKEYRPVDIGTVLLHGHTHGRWKMNGRMIDVGVDAWNYTPVSLEEVLALIASRG